MDKETKQMFELILRKLDKIENRQEEIFSVVKAIGDVIIERKAIK